MFHYALVLVVFSQARILRAVRWVESLALRLPASKIAIISNNDAIDLRPSTERLGRICDDILCINNYNKGAEFGAYEAGLLALPRMDGVIFCNDTIGSNHFLTNRYVEALHRAAINESVEKGIIVGKLGHAERAFEMNGLRSSRWIRTSLFYLDQKSIESINGQLYDPSIDKFIVGESEESLFFDTDIDTILAHQLSKWLFATSGERWYNAEPLTAGNCDRMAAKARAILQERWLSLRLDNRGVAFLPPLMSPYERVVYEAQRRILGAR